MGFLPKHIKVRRYKRNLRIIAAAALAGAVFVRYDNIAPLLPTLWSVRYPDGQDSLRYPSRRDIAQEYLDYLGG